MKTRKNKRKYKNASKTILTNSKKSAIGGKVIASGGFGCVFNPALKCQGKKTRGKNRISKLLTKKHALSEYNEIKEGSKVVLVFRINGLKFLRKQCIMDIDVVQIMLMRPRVNAIIPVNEIIPEKESNSYKNDMLKRIQFREKLKEKKEQARIAFEEAEKTQLLADTLKETATLLSRELKQLEDEYYKDDENGEEE